MTDGQARQGPSGQAAAPLRQAVRASHMRLRVLLVDDHVLVRHGLRSVLESSGRVEVVGEAGTGREALRLLTQESPDVVLLDLRLGDEDGIEVARACREADPGVKVLVVSAHGSSTQLRTALAAGADGYLLKGVTATELVDGLGKVAAGETVIDPAFVPALLHDMATSAVPAGPLTVREIEVLSLVADGLTAGAMARQLQISQRTVNKHLENLFRKVGVSSRPELVQQAFRRGLLR